MLLKHIKLAGFKSFVDPTLIPVRSNLNAIVGPNGCGKSNVVDAIRWVIGEISAKQLRGQSMSDVIFNGTTNRKSVGKAVVELNFDNSKGRIGGEYSKYNELVIRREVDRDGQSSYFINSLSVRRRDVIDVFLGTGLGPRSYAIIEQGMISRLIEAKPEELRVYLEEAAGISKYKDRRRETENRMRHTQENLDRVNDVREELAKQLRHLKRQANAAERYKEYKHEERLLSAQVKVLNWLELDKVLTQKERLLQNQELIKEEKLSLITEIETKIEKIHQLLTDQNQQQNDVQKHYYDASTDIARLEQQVNSIESQSQQWQSELTESESLLEELQNNVFESEEQIHSLTSNVNQLTPQLAVLDKEQLSVDQHLSNAEKEMNQWQVEWEKLQQNSTSTISQSEVLRTRIEHTENRLKELYHRQQRIQQDLQQLCINELHAEISPLESLYQKLQQQLDSLQTQLQSHTDAIQAQRTQNQTLEQSWQQAKSELQSQKAQLTSLQTLQDSILGNDNKQFRRWLNENGLESQPRLGQTLSVMSGWETAVETVLQHYFDAICVSNVADYTESIQKLTQGQVILLDQSVALPQPTSVTPTLAHLVNSEWSCYPWLHGIFVAENFSAALMMRAQLQPHESVITRDGLWLGANWIFHNQTTNTKSGFLEREQRIKELKSLIAEGIEVTERCESSLNSSRQQLSQLETSRDAIHAEFRDLSTKMAKTHGELGAQKTRLENEQQRASQLQQSLQNCGSQLAEQQQLLESIQTEYKTLVDHKQHFIKQRENLLQQRDQYQDTLKQCREMAHVKRKQKDEIEVRLVSSQDHLNRLQQSIKRDQRQLQQLEERRNQLQYHLSNEGAPIDRLKAELQDRLNSRLTTESRLRNVQEQVKNTEQQQRELEAQRVELQKATNNMQSEVEQLRLDRQSILVRKATIEEQLQEVNHDCVEVIKSLPEEATIKDWNSRLEKLAQKIQRLGSINLAAIEEYAATEERKTYLDNQFDDLMKAIEMLKKAVQKIDRETRTRFQETYRKVSERFKVIFPKIFGGGAASLEMTEQDLLITGVIVCAQPPGKRNTNIHMLSGGEKALTAIALVFSLFHLNPAPFCILDEVDAPLDDVNVGRFCQIVKEMSKETQFLMISHNKVSIEAADHLMGVTMQELGVSRIVSVDMKEAIDMVQAA